MDGISVDLLPAFCVYILFTKDMFVFRILIDGNLRSLLYCTLWRHYKRNLPGLWNIELSIFASFWVFSTVRNMSNLFEVGMLEFIKLAYCCEHLYLQQNCFFIINKISGVLFKLLLQLFDLVFLFPHEKPL